MNIYVTQSTPSNANPTVNVKVRNLLFTDQTSLGPSTDASDSDENRQHEPEEDHIQTSSGPSTEDDVIYVSSDEDQQAPLDQLRPLDQRRGRSKRCPLCSTKFPKKNSYRCPVCNKTFVCISNVLRHLRTVHRMSEEQLNRIKPAINRSIKEQHSEEELSGEDEEFGSPLNNSTPTSSVRTLDRSNVTKRRQRLLS